MAGGLATGLHSAVQSLGIKGLEAGFGCGFGIGYGFGAGLMLKPTAWQGMVRSGPQLLGKHCKKGCREHQTYDALVVTL
jgi:hypothetical protein